ncbi:MAG: dTMP kinase, partial [Candidatus Woesearchaeota archaeon]
KNISKIDKFLDWIDDLEYNVFGIPKPDKVFLLYMPCEIGQQLVDKKGHRDYVGGTKKDIHEADINHLKNAEKAYIYVAEKENWEVIKCSDEKKPFSIESIHDEVFKKVKKLL